MEVIDLSAIRKRNMHQDFVLRKLSDCYEYCLIPDYEMKYETFHCHGVQMLDFFITLLEVKGKTMLVSVQFPLIYDVDRVLEFLDYYTFSYNERDKNGYYIKNGLTLIEGKLFKGKPVVIARKGKNRLPYEITEDFEEVTEQYRQFRQIVNTQLAENVEWDGGIGELNEVLDDLDQDDKLERVYPRGSEDDE